MKTINVTFEDAEFEHIDSVKPSGTNWRDFILTLTGYRKGKKKWHTPKINPPEGGGFLTQTP